MFYRIQNHKVLDYSDIKYVNECLITDLCTSKEYTDNLGKFIVGIVEKEIEVPDYEIVTEEYEEQAIDEEGNPVYDEEGNPVMETKTREVLKPIMIDYEDIEIVIDYDEEGNPTGSHEITVIKQKQSTHKETIEVEELVLNPNWTTLELSKAKKEKYNEALAKANSYINSGNALYEFEENKHIEATDGNIGKFTGFTVGYITGRLQPTDTVDWNTKEDETVFLTQEQVGDILDGIGKVQTYIWTVQFPAYVQAIENAQTVEAVEAIEIEYNNNFTIEA